MGLQIRSWSKRLGAYVEFVHSFDLVFLSTSDRLDLVLGWEAVEYHLDEFDSRLLFDLALAASETCFGRVSQSQFPDLVDAVTDTGH